MRIPKIPLVARILIGFIAGTVFGLALSECCSKETAGTVLRYLSPFGTVLVAMLKTVVYPIIFFSLICGAASVFAILPPRTYVDRDYKNRN